MTATLISAILAPKAPMLSLEKLLVPKPNLALTTTIMRFMLNALVVREEHTTCHTHLLPAVEELLCPMADQDFSVNAQWVSIW